jgi:uncharacterized protein
MQTFIQHIAPKGHPVWILMEEHGQIQSFSEKLSQIARSLSAGSIDLSKALPDIKTLSANINASATHYLREENVLFPYLEKHGVAGPTKVMWMEHDQIRALEKQMCELIENVEGLAENAFAAQLSSTAQGLNALISTHFGKENNVLFNAAVQLLNQDEFAEILRQFNEIGYCHFTPGVEQTSDKKVVQIGITADNTIKFDTGVVTVEQMEAILNTLPVEITFIDDNDSVRYYSRPKEMLFTRTKAVIGRKVQLCHPEKSVHLVNKVVADFKSGKKDVAEFWIHMGEKYVHIRYFPVRNPEGKYLGCMEVTQDIAPIQKISGERRLLDWE